MNNWKTIDKVFCALNVLACCALGYYEFNKIGMPFIGILVGIGAWLILSIIMGLLAMLKRRLDLPHWRRELTTGDECMVRVDDKYQKCEVVARYDNRIIIMPGHSLYRADVDINECWPVEEE